MTHPYFGKLRARSAAPGLCRLVGLLLVGLLSASPRAAEIVSLTRFNASGRGDVTTNASVVDGGNLLTVADATTWLAGHGVRVTRAGDDTRLHHADFGWSPPPDALPGTAVAHDGVDKVEGAASVQCTFAGQPPDANGDGLPDPVELCEIDLGAVTEFDFDELKVHLKASPGGAGGLRIRVLRLDDPLNPHDCGAPTAHGRCPTFELDLPASAEDWKEVFVELKRRTGNGLVDHFGGGHRIISLQCTHACTRVDVRLDDLWLVKDFVGMVQKIHTGGKTFELDRRFGRTVPAAIVYHDDTLAVKKWLEQANRPGGAVLAAPPGIYYINGVDLPNVGGAEASRSLPLYNDAHVECAPGKTVFKNTGRSKTGPGLMFRSAAPAPRNIVIANCGFDWNGWNLVDFASVLLISPQTMDTIATDIVIRDNRFFDSRLPGIHGCDFGQDACETRQRHHILVVRVDGLVVDRNELSGGGRIKAGGSGRGRHMYITNNTLDFVNDNAITIVDTIAGVTEHVSITDNTITNPVISGVFFGADGEDAAHVENMALRNIVVARNRISGFFATAAIFGQLPRDAKDIQIVDNVIVNSRDTDVRFDFHSVAGILLSQQSLLAEPAAFVTIRDNRVTAAGKHSVLNMGGIALKIATSMPALTLSGNEVECLGCPIDVWGDAVRSGISFWSGTFDKVYVHGNRVAGANDALRTEGYVTITNGSIHDNEFVESRSVGRLLGQITLIALPGWTIHGKISGNTIADGAGHGVLCEGGGTFLVTGLEDNAFARNAAADISGCP